MSRESYKANNVDEIVRLRLNRLKSTRLCEKLIRDKLTVFPNEDITENIIKSKAIGLSSAIDSALGYLELKPSSLNAKVLSRYYLMMQLTIAEQVGSVKNTFDLEAVQKHTKYGHGLSTISKPHSKFPEDFYTYAVRSGHFYIYCKSLGIETNKYDFAKKPKNFKEIEKENNIISISDLFRRIPELKGVIEEYLNLPPLSFHIGHSFINTERGLANMEGNMDRTGEFTLELPKNSETETTVIDIYSNSTSITLDYIKSLNTPFTNFRYRTDSYDNKKILICDYQHPNDKYWHEYLNTYQSSYSNMSYTVPLWETIEDNIIVNYILLYTLSIIVRYMPDLWYRINSGDLDHIGSLIDYYISVSDHVLPKQMLERITDKNISIHQPGSLFG